MISETSSLCNVRCAWAARSAALASWALAHLVNRVDRWGQYNPIYLREQTYRTADGVERAYGNSYTAPRYQKDRGRVLLGTGLLARHFQGAVPEHVLGLHSTSPENTSRWPGVDIDAHGPEGNDPIANLR